jgi:hypothetical protein
MYIKIFLGLELVKTYDYQATPNSIHVCNVTYVIAPAELTSELMRVEPKTLTLCLPGGRASHHSRLCFRTIVIKSLPWPEHELET